MNKSQLAALFFIGVSSQLSSCASQIDTHSLSASKEENQCFENKDHNYSEVLTCYRKAHEKLPLMYSKKDSTKVDGIEKNTYELSSQTWTSSELVSPEQWLHTVDIYVPDNALKSRAILIINNGINIAHDKNLLKDPSDYSDETLRSIASKTNTITISVSNIPNQYLKYQNDAAPKKEDDSVAYSWKLFLNDPGTEVFSSLHIPMMEAVVKTMDLAEIELNAFNIHRFIVAGTSKRAWTSWHTALVDSRVDAIVPFVIDILNTKKVLLHEYATYGKGWPLAFKPYFSQGVTEKLETSAFDHLMQIEDPLRYLDSAYANRLAIPKYIVNASGDSFFTPDNTQFYFDKLPGIKMLRIAPNSDHYGISKFTENSLVPFVNRFQQSISFPVMTTNVSTTENKIKLHSSFSEAPTEIRQWVAINPTGRDFRYACGTRYIASPLVLSSHGDVSAIIDQPTKGWAAAYIEAQFKDGLVMTSPVYITPDDVYPTQLEPSAIPACQIIRTQFSK